MQEILLIIIAYLIGSIPTAVWISKHYFEIDIRDYGSGNAGATNTYRVLGSKWGTIVMVIDMLKGVIATSLYIAIPFYVVASHDWDRTNIMIGLGLAAVLGHIFPIWANFKGGKGVATLFGMVVAMQPSVALCCVAVFLSVLYLTRFVSLSSILSSIAFAVFILFVFNDDVNSLPHLFGCCCVDGDFDSSEKYKPFAERHRNKSSHFEVSGPPASKKA